MNKGEPINLDDLEARWKIEFEKISPDDLHPYGNRFSKHNNGDYDHSHCQASWLGYKEACKKYIYIKQENDNLKEELNNSKNYHCDHFKSTNNGYIACELKYPDSTINPNKLNLAVELLEEALGYVRDDWVDIENGDHDPDVDIVKEKIKNFLKESK